MARSLLPVPVMNPRWILSLLGALLLLSGCGDAEDSGPWGAQAVEHGGSAGAAITPGTGGKGAADGGPAAAPCGSSCKGETPSCNATTGVCECNALSCGDGKVCQKGACVVDTSCSVAKVAAAASEARAQIESKTALPETVSVCQKQLGMGSFLALATSAVLVISSGTAGELKPKDYDAATSPKDNTVKGDVPKSEYLDIASRVSQFMETNGRAPNSSKDSSLGTYMGFDNLVYLYTEVLDEYHTKGMPT